MRNHLKLHCNKFRTGMMCRHCLMFPKAWLSLIWYFPVSYNLLLWLLPCLHIPDLIYLLRNLVSLLLAASFCFCSSNRWKKRIIVLWQQDKRCCFSSSSVVRRLRVVLEISSRFKRVLSTDSPRVIAFSILIVQHPGKAQYGWISWDRMSSSNCRMSRFVVSNLMDSGVGFITCFGLEALVLLFSCGKILISQFYNQFCFGV